MQKKKKFENVHLSIDIKIIKLSIFNDLDNSYNPIFLIKIYDIKYNDYERPLNREKNFTSKIGIYHYHALKE